jgi:hypothetical protein
MFRQSTSAMLSILLAGTASAQTTPADTGKPATIPFVRFGEIHDFEPDGTQGVYLETRARKWYYASVYGPCTNLPFAARIGVDTRFAGDQLDSSGTLLVDGDRCRIEKLVESGPPPKAEKKRKH